MIKTYLPFTALFLLLLCVPVHAERGAIGASIRAVDEFYNETQNLTKDLADSPAVKEMRAASLEQKDAAVKNLENLNRVDRPGKKRFKQAYGIAASYMDARIEAVKALPQASPEDKARIGGIAKTLLALKAEKLNAISETEKFERTDEKKIKPVPSIDRSPYENSPEGDKGIWER
ncbi:MAG: hypothetical protein HZB82_07710 [Deltaproteobacteria bacterium]|nr:hypothetical protein [Deltaproteobacteria bacterium]